MEAATDANGVTSPEGIRYIIDYNKVTPMLHGALQSVVARLARQDAAISALQEQLRAQAQSIAALQVPT